MNEHAMMIAAIMLNNRNRNQDKYKQNPLTTREMAMVRQPRAEKSLSETVIALAATLKNRLARRETEPVAQPSKKTRQASLS